MKIKKEHIPSWLYFPLAGPKMKISEENELLAFKILKSLKEKAEINQWNIEKIISYNEHDDANGYLMKPK